MKDPLLGLLINSTKQSRRCMWTPILLFPPLSSSSRLRKRFYFFSPPLQLAFISLPDAQRSSGSGGSRGNYRSKSQAPPTQKASTCTAKTRLKGPAAPPLAATAALEVIKQRYVYRFFFSFFQVQASFDSNNAWIWGILFSLAIFGHGKLNRGADQLVGELWGWLCVALSFTWHR